MASPLGELLVEGRRGIADDVQVRDDDFDRLGEDLVPRDGGFGLSNVAGRDPHGRTHDGPHDGLQRRPLDDHVFLEHQAVVIVDLDIRLREVLDILPNDVDDEILEEFLKHFVLGGFNKIITLKKLITQYYQCYLIRVLWM